VVLDGRTVSGGYRFGFQNQEKDDEIKGEGNSVNYTFRIHDPRLGRWLSKDPLEVKYPELSPYNFVANTPLIAIDPDGRLIIFVNGFTYGCEPHRPYWTEKGDQFIDAASSYFHDYNSKLFLNGESFPLYGAARRQTMGQEYVRSNLQIFKDAVARGESINIVSHSMGAAFSEGMIEELANNGITVDKVVHFSAADASDIKIASNTLGTERIQLTMTGDMTLDDSDPFTAPEARKIPGVDIFGIVKFDVDKMHPNASVTSRNEWDSHYDTKTYGAAFDYVRDLENVSLNHIKTEIMPTTYNINGGYPTKGMGRQYTYESKTPVNSTVFWFYSKGGRNVYQVKRNSKTGIDTYRSKVKHEF
jgi:RHS repeat-associated protein